LLFSLGAIPNASGTKIYYSDRTDDIVILEVSSTFNVIQRIPNKMNGMMNGCALNSDESIVVVAGTNTSNSFYFTNKNTTAQQKVPVSGWNGPAGARTTTFTISYDNKTLYECWVDGSNAFGYPILSGIMKLF